MRVCKRCGIEKPLEEFHKNPGAKLGRRWTCKVCFNSKSKSRYHASPDVRVAKKETQKAWRERNQERDHKNRQSYKLVYCYGITEEVYADLLAHQGGVCAICGKTESGPRRKRLAVDHSHKTGEVRGLLCMRCNQAIGLLGDSAFTILRAAYYLSRWESKAKGKQGGGKSGRDSTA